MAVDSGRLKLFRKILASDVAISLFPKFERYMQTAGDPKTIFISVSTKSSGVLPRCISSG